MANGQWPMGGAKPGPQHARRQSQKCAIRNPQSAIRNPLMFPPAANERQSRVDWLMMSAIAGLMVLGELFVYSATMANESAALTEWYSEAWFKQLVWYA